MALGISSAAEADERNPCQASDSPCFCFDRSHNLNNTAVGSRVSPATFFGPFGLISFVAAFFSDNLYFLSFSCVWWIVFFCVTSLRCTCINQYNVCPASYAWCYMYRDFYQPNFISLKRTDRRSESENTGTAVRLKYRIPEPADGGLPKLFVLKYTSRTVLFIPPRKLVLPVFPRVFVLQAEACTATPGRGKSPVGGG